MSMTRRTFFRSALAALAALPVAKALYERGKKDGHKWGVNAFKCGGIVHTRPGVKLTKWQPPVTAHSIMFHAGYVWWLDTEHPAAVFNKPIAELSDGAKSDSLLWFSQPQNPNEFS